jgi:limonene-1,2-epoxide hydrolase
MPRHLGETYGTDARNRLDEATNPGREGAVAALESFYYAFNQRDLAVFRQVWTTDPLAQLNNPLGGILRGGDAITALYERVFHGPARVTVTLGDIVEYSGEGQAVFAGRETGEYRVTEPVPLSIRTTRFFAYEAGRWVQVHHHGSIDDAEALAAYQAAIRG